ncbi:MAG: hypothetical protein HKN37_00115 [Rhodothermales bacterium]|nr:hypothetical protein [Rhodothermales bacterium]
MSKTLHTAQTVRAAADTADPNTQAADQLGAIIKMVSRCCDAFIASEPVAETATALWSEIVFDTPGRNVGIPIPPVTATDHSAALNEARVLAADGLRVAVMGAGVATGAAPDLGPFVSYVVDHHDGDASIAELEFIARSPQQAVDLGIIAHMAAELSLCPVTVRLAIEDGIARFDTINIPDAALLSHLLGTPSDEIDSPNAYQKTAFGTRRRRVPETRPAELDAVQLIHDAPALLSKAIAAFESATGRSYTLEARDDSDVDHHAGDNEVRALLVSTRGYRIARRIAEISTIDGACARVVGDPRDRSFDIFLGSASETSLAADVLLCPGAARRELEHLFAGIRPGGLALFESQSSDPEDLWYSLGESSRQTVRDLRLRLFATPTQRLESAPGIGFEEIAASLLIAVRAGTLPDSPTISGDGSASSNGESPHDADTVTDAAFLEVPWHDFEDGPDFYSGSAGLHMEREEASVASDEVRRQLLAFHHTGRDVGVRLDDAGLVPAQLYDYVSSPSVRGPYPVLIPVDHSGPELPLAIIMDGLLGDESAGSQGERESLVRKLEVAVLAEFSQDPEALLSELWNRAENRILATVSDDDASDAQRKQLKELRSLAPDGRLHDLGRATMIQILKRTVDREWETMFAPIKEDAEGLAVMMEEFLRADFGGSEEGRDPEHLRASVGKGYADALDFEALSKLVEESNVAERMSTSQRTRLESVSDDLRALPIKLARARQNGTLSGTEGLTQAVARSHENLRTLAALIRAIRIALLESSGSYREEFHDSVFDQFGVMHLTDEERSVCPPYIVDLGPSSTLSRTARGALMELLGSDLPIKILVSIDDIPSGIRTASEKASSLSVAADIAMQAVGLGRAHVTQSPASELTAFIDSAMSGTRYHGPALYSICQDLSTTLHDKDRYLASAVALEARAFPIFTFDPAPTDWADRFNIAANPAADQPWSRSEITYSSPQSSRNTLSTAFTFADFLALDPRHTDHFRMIPGAQWQPEMIPVEDFIDIDEASSANRIPYIWMADERGRMQRVIVTYPVTDAARAALRKWKTLQELGGVKSSHAERLIEAERATLDEERQNSIAEAEEKVRTELDKATGTLAREIVANIAAGLLGLRPTGDALQASAAAPQVMPSDPTDVIEEAAEVVEAEPAAVVEEEEEEAITLDEPYIETPRCTSCNECTNMNSRMYAYDGNKQAYIKDASAGSFRELVLAAEKCPVRIIHPGKPRNPDEPGLEDLIRRAQPFQ